MIKTPAILLASIWFSTVALSASAQTPQNAGEPSGAVSAEMDVIATSPVLYPCKFYGSSTCFRMYFEIRPKRASEVRLGEIRLTNSLYQTSAFAGTGASCLANSLGGLPRGGLNSQNGVEWYEKPFSATRQKPAVYIVEFGCDGQLLAGDGVTVQLTFSADATGRGAGIARFVFPQLSLQATTRR